MSKEPMTFIHKIQNLSELEQLIEKANDELQLLQGTMEKIKNFEFVLEQTKLEGYFKWNEP
ncbi:hypothetical protein [Robertmurraya sp.]|uniref:hypothetical protein n=1 Tax=Robertmurraya sp. TaxID=2837525 RepID=UPI003704C0CD